MPEEIVAPIVEEVIKDVVDTPEVIEPAEEMIPKSQMEKIIKDRVAREKKATEKAIEEAKKLAKMNDDEKVKYDLEKLQKELEEYKRKDSYYGLSKEAQKMLSEHDITADEDLLSLVVKDDADATKQAIDSFVSVLTKKVDEGVKKALAGNSPKVHNQTPNVMTKEQFSALTYPEKVELKRTNEELYKQLSTF